MKKGKKYQDLVKSFDKQELFELDAAIAQVKKLATAKFD
ncbi:MAG: 50S ribosomal protein L1, partial [Acetobacterium sp.]|nr:50S ribosomal protein L1 [Acetobacterium sp.]